MLSFMLLAFALPAYANNPPQPDGLFSALLIFPIVILGARLAGVVAVQESRATRILGGVAVAILAIVFLGAGTFIGAFVALAVVIYAFVRGGRIMRRGQGAKRLVIGAVVMAFALFAFLDYIVSLNNYYPSLAIYESSAIYGLRALKTAEDEFIQPTDSHRPPSPAYGAIQELERAKLVDDTFSAGQIRKGYRYGELLDPARKQYLFYAVPATELKPASSQVAFVPGSSLLTAIFGRRQKQEGTGIRSFAIDETGVIRSAIRTQTGPVTREEAQHWPPL
jgi:hypothetical protein